MRNYIKLKSGKIISLHDIIEKIPFTFVRLSPEHYDVCELVANNYFLFKKGSREWKVLLNYLTQRSEKTKLITAIVLLSKKERVEEIHIEFIDNNFSSLFEGNPKILDGDKLYSFIDFSFKNLVSKVVLNKLYRLLRKRKATDAQSVIRTWVDVNETQFKTQFETSLVLIYPFGINVKRGLRYIRHCFSSYPNVSLMGVDYSGFSLLKLLLGKSTRKDILLIDFEISAHVKHSKFFEKFENVYTADEWTPSVYALYSARSGFQKITNDMHGIGFYNPYINYTHIKVFNEKQKEYYLKRNPNIEAEVKNYIPYSDVSTAVFHGIVYIDQGDLKKYGLIYESSLQKRLLKRLGVIDEKINIYVKFHPNRTESEMKSFIEMYPFFNVINTFELDKKYLFVNLYSTAYYDYYKYGSFIFIEEDLFDPSLFFGNEIQKFNIESLVESIMSFNFNGYLHAKN